MSYIPIKNTQQSFTSSGNVVNISAFSDGKPVIIVNTDENTTINITAPVLPQELIMVVNATGGITGRNVTFGAGFDVLSNITGLLNSAGVVSFVQQGGQMREVSRTIGL